MAAFAMPQADTSRSRVLVVDDDPFVCMIVRQLLKEHDFLVETRESGEECIEALMPDNFSSQPFAVVCKASPSASYLANILTRHLFPAPRQLLLDWELSDMTAIELLQAMDGKASHLMESGLRIFIVSGNERPDSLDVELAMLQCIKVEGYWTKPVSAEKVKLLQGSTSASSHGAS